MKGYSLPLMLGMVAAVILGDATPVFIVVVGEDGSVKDIFMGTEENVAAIAALKQTGERTNRRTDGSSGPAAERSITNPLVRRFVDLLKRRR